MLWMSVARLGAMKREGMALQEAAHTNVLPTRESEPNRGRRFLTVGGFSYAGEPCQPFGVAMRLIIEAPVRVRA
jgi:hypothetical protein